MQLMQVKREPTEASPAHFNYAGNLSPMYPGQSPGPPSPHNNPSPVPYTAYAPYPSQQFNVRVAGGGGLVDLNPSAGPAVTPIVPPIYPDTPLNNLNNPFSKPVNKSVEPERNTVLDMDSHQLSLELSLGNLDSGELARMAMFTDANLSENLSSNLTLSERLDNDRPQDQAMTDSFTRVANNAIQELVCLGSGMYPSHSQPQ